MLISHKHRFIFLKTGKTGGTSTEVFLQRYCMDEYVIPERWELVEQLKEPQLSDTGVVGVRTGNAKSVSAVYNHMPAGEIRELFGESLWKEYFKFANVRNPWDKAVSQYFHLHLPEDFKSELPDLKTLKRSFSDFASNYGRGEVERFLQDPSNELDDYIRYENLTAEVQRICDRLDIQPDGEFPRLKTQFRPAHWRDYRDLYTPAARDRVGDVYADWISKFNYSF